MIHREKNSERLDELLAVLRNQELNESESAELREILNQVPEGYRRLSEHLIMTSLLEEEVKMFQPVQEPAQRKFVWLHALKWRFAIGTAAAMFAALLFLLSPGPRISDPKTSAGAGRGVVAGESVDHGVALLTETLGAVCEQDGVPLHTGGSLRPGSFIVKGGIARVEFYSGASIIIEGDAQLNIKSSIEATLLGGKLLANVPPHAQGFTIHSREIELVDQGTEFGVSVNEKDGTQVHVLNGKVEVFDPKSNRSPQSKKEMLAGAALRVAPGGETTTLLSGSQQFVTSQDLHARLSANLQERSRKWNDLSAAMRQNPRVIAYFPFEKDDSNDRRLQNFDHSGELLAGSIVGATWTEGRWPGKDALEFKRPGDRVRITIPGHHKAITLLAWVRVDGFDNIYNSLLLSDGWGRPGALHWEFLTGGAVELSVCAEGGADFDYRSPEQKLRSYDLGRWLQLAVVYDDQGKVATHYIDGVPVQITPISDAIVLEIGAAHIGNWSPSGYQDSTPVRNFNGRIDELVIFDAALSSQEIAGHFENGRPQL